MFNQLVEREVGNQTRKFKNKTLKTRIKMCLLNIKMYKANSNSKAVFSKTAKLKRY